MCKLGVVSQERLKIEVQLLLSANGKSCLPCGLAQQRMTLNVRFTHRALSLRQLSILFHASLHCRMLMLVGDQRVLKMLSG